MLRARLLAPIPFQVTWPVWAQTPQTSSLIYSLATGTPNPEGTLAWLRLGRVQAHRPQPPRHIPRPQASRDAALDDFGPPGVYTSAMTIVIDKLRHPEKAHRPDNEIQ